MAVVNKRGYPQSNGAKVECIARVSGVNYTAGTAQPITARALGIDTIEHIEGGMSESGTYVVIGKVSAAGVGGLHWFTASNGSEATADVSAEYVTIRVIGVG
jgi:hypothetical protein